jgi:hypothetical protein
LSVSLNQLGIECDVEARDRLAVLRFPDSAGADRLCIASVRATVVDVARGHGFTHVGVEVGTDRR